MGDVQRCFKCNDGLAEIMKEDTPMCAKCAGILNIADRFQQLNVTEQDMLRKMYTNRLRLQERQN